MSSSSSSSQRPFEFGAWQCGRGNDGAKEAAAAAAMLIDSIYQKNMHSLSAGCSSHTHSEHNRTLGSNEIFNVAVVVGAAAACVQIALARKMNNKKSICTPRARKASGARTQNPIDPLCFISAHNTHTIETRVRLTGKSGADKKSNHVCAASSSIVRLCSFVRSLCSRRPLDAFSPLLLLLAHNQR